MNSKLEGKFLKPASQSNNVHDCVYDKNMKQEIFVKAVYNNDWLCW